MRRARRKGEERRGVEWRGEEGRGGEMEWERRGEEMEEERKEEEKGEEEAEEQSGTPRHLNRRSRLRAARAFWPDPNRTITVTLSNPASI